jgi:hypothetical protein
VYANRIDIPIFTNDKDFEHYQNIISIKIFKLRANRAMSWTRGPCARLNRPMEQLKRNSVMNSESQIAYCGLYCGDCIIRKGKLASLANALLSQMRKPEFEKLAEGLPQIMPEQFKAMRETKGCVRVLESMAHLGCYKICKDGGGGSSCPIRVCCLNKHIEGCWCCEEFETCETLSWINPVQKDAHRKNIGIIRRNGIEIFLKGTKDW